VKKETKKLYTIVNTINPTLAQASACAIKEIVPYKKHIIYIIRTNKVNYFLILAQADACARKNKHELQARASF
jgi:septin family protein